jgi:hypothetical protein
MREGGWGYRPRRRKWTMALVVIAVFLFGVCRLIFPERPMDHVGPRALLDGGFALGLLCLVVLLAGSLGWKVQRWLRLGGLTRLERAVFALPIGLGILAYGVLALGFVGVLRPWALLLWLAAVGCWTRREWGAIVDWAFCGLPRRLRALVDLPLGEKLLLVLGGGVLVFVLSQSLSPPYGYDSLMYHLQAPRLFLSAGRVYLLPDIWQSNGPFTIEMLFTLGLAFGSDTFARLVHVLYAVCLILVAYGLGRRFVGREGGWVAAMLVLGVPILPFWACLAYADLAWALYESLALYALLVWQKRRRRGWLLLAGLAMGWALGSKYLALGGGLVLGLWVVWESRRLGWRKLLVQCVSFGLPAALVALPWYLKNWLLGGNPVYPFYFGGSEWDMERLDLLMAHLDSFGVGRSFLDYVLLPWNLYARSGSFGVFGTIIEIPGLLFPLVLLYPLARRYAKMDQVVVLVLLRFVLWSLGSQQTRFLLPLFPALGLLAAGGLFCLSCLFKSRPLWGKLVLILPTGAVVLVTCLLQFFLLQVFWPFDVILGQESKDAFLRRTVADYPAVQFVQRELPEARVLMMWDGQSYYCDARCLPDTEPSNWTRLVSTFDVHTVTARLQASGVTHLLFKVEDVNWSLSHDPTGRHRQSVAFFEDEFRPACLQVVYQDESVSIFEVTCR